MSAPALDVATEAFLEAALSDFRRQLGRSAHLDTVRIERDGPETVLVATIRIGRSTAELRGHGGSVIEAYGDLCRGAPEPILVMAFRELVTH